MWSCLAGLIGRAFTQTTYSSNLEQYINDRNPQNACDIDRLTKQYELGIMGRNFL